MNEAFIELVIKLSEASFRPLFLKVRSVIYIVHLIIVTLTHYNMISMNMLIIV